MDVKDTFFFADGTTAFIGPIDTEAKFVGACECELVKDHEVKASFWIDGEMIPRPGESDERPPYRSISTREALDLVAKGLGRSNCTIRSKDPSGRSQRHRS
jgi:hypothetical protein